MCSVILSDFSVNHTGLFLFKHLHTTIHVELITWCWFSKRTEYSEGKGHQSIRNVLRAPQKPSNFLQAIYEVLGNECLQFKNMLHKIQQTPLVTATFSCILFNATASITYITLNEISEWVILWQIIETNNIITTLGTCMGVILLKTREFRVSLKVLCF
jgi:hypothetical protein